MRIETLWLSLRQEVVSAQRRVDPEHPLDLYADFEPPDRPGLVLFCPARPPDFKQLKTIRIERLQRGDGRWSLRVLLEDQRLMPVFIELCRDIIDFTRTGVEPARGGAVLIARIERWRTLLQAAPSLGTAALRGLIGELLVLETLMAGLGQEHAVNAWTGPFGTPQDFQLPSGERVEVKTIDIGATHAIINGLDQLDAGGDPLRLMVVRVEDTGIAAPGALTVPVLLTRIRSQLNDHGPVLERFESLLRLLGWAESADPGGVVVRLDRIDNYDVGPTFPRLIARAVPSGVIDATYKIELPPLVIAK